MHPEPEAALRQHAWGSDDDAAREWPQLTPLSGSINSTEYVCAGSA